jgi:N-acetylmuramoyl-L-alanine amidase
MWRGFRLFALSSSALLLLPVLSPQLWMYKKSGFSAFSQKWVLSGALLQQNPLPPANAPQIAQSPAPEEPIGVTVILDPAHGGADFGARGPTGLAESDVVLDFARAARIALEAQRLRVLLTREGNQNPSFDNRSAMVNGLHNAIFISLHVSSSGPVGTARTYYYLFPSAVAPGGNSTGIGASSQPQPSAGSVVPQGSAPPSSVRNGMIEWDRAQRSSIDLSRQLAELTQAELARRFKGSPDIPAAAPVRQLRTIASPAIAIELSSIDVTDAKRLEQMAQPLAEAVGRAVAEFHYPLTPPAVAPNGGH